jgi:3-hydroxybutyryl-CoA dehydrogenase
MKNIQVIGIVGAGQMGRGIAQVAAQTGFDVILFDAYKNSLDFGHNFIKTQLDKGVEKSKWSADDAKKAFLKN